MPAKQKQPTRKKHWNKVLHPNRYFIWALFVVIIGLGALTAYINVSSIQISNDTVFSQLQARHTYVDPNGKWSVQYPAYWQLDTDALGNVTFENPSNGAENITVNTTTLDMEAVLRKAIAVKQEIDTEKPGYSVAFIKSSAGAKAASDAGTNSTDVEFDVALIKTRSTLYYISGHSEFFQGFVNNFKPLK